MENVNIKFDHDDLENLDYALKQVSKDLKESIESREHLDNKNHFDPINQGWRQTLKGVLKIHKVIQKNLKKFEE